MKSSLESLSTLERRLKVEVPSQSVKDAFQRAYRTIQKEATVKGFRKGKAPLQTIVSLYSDRVKQDVVQDLVQKHYTEALKTHSLDPISFPAINFDDINDGSDFEFSAQFEVRPDVKVNDFKNLEVKTEKLDVSDARIQATLDQIVQSRSELKDIDEARPAQNGDTADIDFEGMVDGSPLPNGSAQGHSLELGSNSFIPGFEEGIVGMSVGDEKEIKLKFPEEYHAKDIAGKDVVFKVKLNALKKKVAPEINDELAKSMGGFDSLDKLKEEIKKDIQNTDSKRIKDETKNRVLRALVAKNPVEVPNSLLQEQKKALEDDFKKRLVGQGFNEGDFAEYKDKWATDFDETARFMIQSSFLIDKLAQQENLQATEDDVHKKIHEFAAQMGVDEKRVSEFYHEPKRHQQLHYQVSEEKVIDFLLGHAKVKEVSAADLREEQN